jgi:peptidoglycan/xylan/chitin deacetylase (PgdA/CDA1 family)
VKRKYVRRALRVLSCALALAGGALLASQMAPARAAQSAYKAPLPLEATPSPEPRGEGPEAVEVPLPLTYDPIHPDPFGARMAGGRIITGRTPHRLLLFTFDDGPNRRTTPKLLDYLDTYGVKGVFFLTTSRMRGDNNRQRLQQRIAQDILRRGHVLANHTLDHLQLPALDDIAVAEQIDESARIFEEVLGERPWLLRPPGGSRSVRIDNMITARGYTSVLWNLGTGDFQVQSPEEVYRVFMRVLEVRERDEGDRGGIVLLHDIHDHSVDAFPLIMDELRRRNCELLAEGEELYDIVDDPTLFFAPREEGSPASAVAPPLVLPDDVLEARQRRLREETAQLCQVTSN